MRKETTQLSTVCVYFCLRICVSICVCVLKDNFIYLASIVHSFYSFHSLHSFSLSFCHFSDAFRFVFVFANVSAFNFQLACTKVCNMFFSSPPPQYHKHTHTYTPIHRDVAIALMYACMTSSNPSPFPSLTHTHTHCRADNGLHKF